jgi:hypothetical protein
MDVHRERVGVHAILDVCGQRGKGLKSGKFCGRRKGITQTAKHTAWCLDYSAANHVRKLVGLTMAVWLLTVLLNSRSDGIHNIAVVNILYTPRQTI